MFKDFFLKEQERLSKHLENSIFHLDDFLALRNLDILLRIETLDGIQWVPGAVAKPMSEWINICAKVLNAKKCLQISCTPNEVAFLLSKLKHEGLFISTSCNTERKVRNFLKIVEKYH